MKTVLCTFTQKEIPLYEQGELVDEFGRAIIDMSKSLNELLTQSKKMGGKVSFEKSRTVKGSFNQQGMLALPQSEETSPTSLWRWALKLTDDYHIPAGNKRDAALLAYNRCVRGALVNG